MLIHTPRSRPQATGFWAFEDQSERLVHVDAHAGSTLHTRWPVLDRWQAELIERGVDWLLNAAAAGRERLDAALRAHYPGSRRDVPVDHPLQSHFWYRVASPGSLGAQAQLFLGDGSDGSFGGLVVDDSNDGTTVAGWAGPSSSQSNGRGPGRGYAGFSRDRGGGGGGYALDGSTGGTMGSGGKGGTGGRSVPATHVFEAMLAKTYTAAMLGLGGSGGTGTHSPTTGEGDGGDAALRSVIGDLTEATDRTLTGADGADASLGGGGGSGQGGGPGGLYLAIVTGKYALASDTDIDCNGGSGGSSRGPDGGGQRGAGGGNGSDGRVVICYGDRVDTSSGTISNATLKTYQLLAAVTPGGLLVM